MDPIETAANDYCAHWHGHATNFHRRPTRLAGERARKARRGVGRGLAIVLGFGLSVAVLAADTPRRIISTDASITELILALGAGERLVGVDVTSRLPDAAADLPRVGYHRALSAEGLLSLKPDLMLASDHAGPPAVLAALSATQLQIQQLPVPLSIEALQENIRAVAATLDVDAAGDELVASLAERQRRLTTAAFPGPRTVLLRESEGVLRVAGSGTAGAALVALLGGTNGATFAGYRSFSSEAVLALKPELLLIAAPAEAQSRAAWLDRYPLLRHSPAAAAGQVAFVAAEALVGGMSIAAVHEAEAVLRALSGNMAAVP